MIQIHTLSVFDFKQTMKNNGLSDANIEQRTDLAIISIGNSFEEDFAENDFADDLFANGPSSHWFRKFHRNVLNLDFDDISTPAEWKNLSSCTQYVLFDDEMAQLIVGFVEKNKDASVWIIHCSAGVSRSGAVAQWLKDWLEMKYSVKPNNVDGCYATPNPHVLRILNRLLYR